MQETCFTKGPDTTKQCVVPESTDSGTWGSYRSQYLLSGAVVIGWGLLLSASLTQDAPAQSPTQTANTTQEHSTNTKSKSQQDVLQADNSSDRQPIGEAPALGVIVASCPADAVCVRGTVWQSPADLAGIQEGDYILSLNGQKVTSPAELRRAVEQTNVDEEVALELWRNGKTFTKQLYVAKMSDELPAGQQAWLGVQLQDSEEGVEMIHVLEYGPADEAGLRDGDIVQQLNGRDVASVEDFVEQVGDLGPGAQVNLAINREGRQQQIEAELGSIDDAPMSFLRQAYGTPSWQSDDQSSLESDSMVDATLDVLRQQIRELKRQINDMNADRGQGQLPEPKRNGQPGQRQPESSQGAQLLIPLSPRDSGFTDSLVKSEPTSQTPSASYDNEGPNLEFAPFAFPGSASPIAAALSSLMIAQQRGNNDRGSRGDWDRNNAQRYRNNFRGYNRSYNPYSNYGRSSYYRNPYYGGSYYGYGGRQYYYRPGAGYGYGPRSGIRLGPNLGIYWY